MFESFSYLKIVTKSSTFLEEIIEHNHPSLNQYYQKWTGTGPTEKTQNWAEIQSGYRVKTIPCIPE